MVSIFFLKIFEYWEEFAGFVGIVVGVVFEGVGLLAIVRGFLASLWGIVVGVVLIFFGFWRWGRGGGGDRGFGVIGGGRCR